MWEEPPISGTRGSGTVFFSGCSLGCVFCQNRDISRGVSGIRITTERLSEIMLELEDAGAHNINFVTPTHYVPTIREAIISARRQGLAIPIVYTTGSYDTPETLRSLDGLVDIYLPDFKYYRPETARLYSHAADYPAVARAAIAEMVRQTGRAELDADGLMTRGTVVRILLLPGHVAEAKLILHYLYATYGDSIYLSLMNQYTPMNGMKSPLDRRVTREEYDQLTDYALRLGVTNCFIQDGGTAEESFIPPFDNAGVLPRNK
jgi:putative pyruvate formate lyase activating enzyme